MEKNVQKNRVESGFLPTRTGPNSTQQGNPNKYRNSDGGCRGGFDIRPYTLGEYALVPEDAITTPATVKGACKNARRDLPPGLSTQSRRKFC
jgi:hypothetical protein